MASSIADIVQADAAQREERLVGKLVRDRIPGIIEADGRVPVRRTLTDHEYEAALLAKLKEEATELAGAAPADRLQEGGRGSPARRGGRRLRGAARLDCPRGSQPGRPRPGCRPQASRAWRVRGTGLAPGLVRPRPHFPQCATPTTMGRPGAPAPR